MSFVSMDHGKLPECIYLLDRDFSKLMHPETSKTAWKEKVVSVIISKQEI